MWNKRIIKIVVLWKRRHRRSILWVTVAEIFVGNYKWRWSKSNIIKVKISHFHCSVALHYNWSTDEQVMETTQLPWMSFLWVKAVSLYHCLTLVSSSDLGSYMNSFSSCVLITDTEIIFLFQATSAGWIVAQGQNNQRLASRDCKTSAFKCLDFRKNTLFGW